MWSRLFPEIACKKFQSPIRIYTDQCEFDPTLAQRPFVFTAGENCCQTLENTGSSFQVTGSGYSGEYRSEFYCRFISDRDLMPIWFSFNSDYWWSGV